MRWFGVAKRKPLENTYEAREKFKMIWCGKRKPLENTYGEHEVGEKFEMIWCGKEKAIEEYKEKACAVDVWYV